MIVQYTVSYNTLYKINDFSIAKAKVILALLELIGKKNIYIQTYLFKKIRLLIRKI